MSKQTYTIKPLRWTEWPNRQHALPDGTAQAITLHSTSGAVLDYTVTEFQDGLCSVFVQYPDNGMEADSDWLESIEAAKEWCQSHLARYLSPSLDEFESPIPFDELRRYWEYSFVDPWTDYYYKQYPKDRGVIHSWVRSLTVTNDDHALQK